MLEPHFQIWKEWGHLYEGKCQPKGEVVWNSFGEANQVGVGKFVQPFMSNEETTQFAAGGVFPKVTIYTQDSLKVGQ